MGLIIDSVEKGWGDNSTYIHVGYKWGDYIVDSIKEEQKEVSFNDYIWAYNAYDADNVLIATFESNSQLTISYKH